MIPQAKNVLGQSGAAVRPSNAGIAVLLAPSSSGPINVPSGFFDYNAAIATFGSGPLLELAALHQPVAGKKFILMRPNTSVAASYSAVTYTGTGTTVPTAHSGSAPTDDFNAIITFLTSGTIGVTGIQYTYSLDGNITSAPQALGTATNIVIPNTGIQIDLTHTSNTVVAKDTITFSTKAARMNDADLSASLAILQRTSQAWETVFPFMDGLHTSVVILDAWLETLEGLSQYQHSAVVNWRLRAQDGSETEAQYATAFQTEFGTTNSDRVVVCADGCQTVSPITGLTQTRYTASPVLARGMLIDISVDPAQQGDGPLPNVTIEDGNGQPIFHDEQHDPGLDDLRATTLRSFPDYTGAYIGDAKLLSASTSRYVYWQHIRLMGRARAISSQMLTALLSSGVNVDQSTGFILEADAQHIDGIVNDKLEPEFITSNPKRVSAILFTLSRTDPLTSDSPVFTATLQLSFKKYIKGFLVTSTVTDTITVAPSS